MSRRASRIASRTGGHMAGQVAVEYAVALVFVAMVLFVSVDGVSLLSLVLDALRQLNFNYVQGLGSPATPI